MKKIIKCLLFIQIFIPVYLLAETAPSSDKVIKQADKPIVVGKKKMLNQIEYWIGNEMITTIDIEEPLRQLRLQFSSQMSKEELDKKMSEVRQQHINTLIESKLLLIEAKAQGIKIQDKMVEARLTEEMEKIKSGFATVEDLEKELKRENLTLEKLRDQSRRKIKEDLFRQYLMQKKLQEFKANIEITDTDIKKYYEEKDEEFQNKSQVKLQQIFIAYPDKNLDDTEYQERKAQAEQKAKKVWQELEAGKDFGAIAREYSEHKASAELGGEIGWLSEGDTGLPEFDKIVFEQLKINAFSKIISTQRGYFIVKVLDRKAGEVIPLEKARDSIRQRIIVTETEKRYKTWVDSLRSKYEIINAKQKNKIEEWFK